MIAAGCEQIQFDEPMWTESPEQSEWAVDILNELIASLRNRCVWGCTCAAEIPAQTRVLHQYTDLAPAFRKVRSTKWCWSIAPSATI